MLGSAFADCFAVARGALQRDQIAHEDLMRVEVSMNHLTSGEYVHWTALSLGRWVSVSSVWCYWMSDMQRMLTKVGRKSDDRWPEA